MNTKASKIIGLTGNIATGKSVIRRMLANSGGLGIDADQIGHRMLYPDGPAYQAVINTFGEKILSEDGRISRSKLGEVVFKNPGKLNQLESLTHPPVINSIRRRIETSGCPFTVVEVIKLFESDCVDLCDTIWVSHASRSHQLDRLLQSRNMDKVQASQRIDTQSPQSTKLERADVVINTEGTFNSTWVQVQQALNDTIQVEKEFEQMDLNNPKPWASKPVSLLSQKKWISFWKENSGEDLNTLYKWLGQHMILPVLKDDELSALVIWDNHNFTATLQKIIPEEIMDQSSAEVIEVFQNDCQMKQIEMIFLSKKSIQAYHLQPAQYGFQHQTIEALAYPAWQEAGQKIVEETEEQIWVKNLAQPIEIKG